MTKLLLPALLLFVACGPDCPPYPPDWHQPPVVVLEDGGIQFTDAGVEAQDDAGTAIDGGVDQDDPDAGVDAGTPCKPGFGWGDKNHCHVHR